MKKKTPSNPKGAGRPRKEPTTTIRIPSILKPIILRWINKKKNKLKIRL